MQIVIHKHSLRAGKHAMIRQMLQHCQQTRPVLLDLHMLVEGSENLLRQRFSLHQIAICRSLQKSTDQLPVKTVLLIGKEYLIRLRNHLIRK